MIFSENSREQGNPWELCKGFDSSAAIGDFVPVDRYKDIRHLNFNLLIDGKEVQKGCTADMLFKVDDIIAYVSQFVTLKIGDLLFTGTPGRCRSGQYRTTFARISGRGKTIGLLCPLMEEGKL